jgi:hypothetical protein
MKKQGKGNNKVNNPKTQNKNSRRKNVNKTNQVLINSKISKKSAGSSKPTPIKNSNISQTKSKIPKIAKARKTKALTITNFKFSDSQKKQLNQFEAVFSKKSIVELKSILKENNQIQSGSKSDLVDRCSQGKLLGSLPMCSKCSGGKLRFNVKTGQYYCPGYMDDTDFINCGFRANFEDVLRNPWID